MKYSKIPLAVEGLLASSSLTHHSEVQKNVSGTMHHEKSAIRVAHENGLYWEKFMLLTGTTLMIVKILTILHMVFCVFVILTEFVVILEKDFMSHCLPKTAGGSAPF